MFIKQLNDKKLMNERFGNRKRFENCLFVLMLALCLPARQQLE